MDAYLLKSERRIYPVTEEEFQFATQCQFEHNQTKEITYICKKVNAFEARLNPEWKAIERSQGNTLILYSEYVRIRLVRREYQLRYAPYAYAPKITQIEQVGAYVEDHHKEVHFVTCALCLCDHAYFYCKQVQSKTICEECRQEIAYAKATVNVADYIARKKLATPSWANLEAIERIYTEARIKTLQTGIEHHVDHIIALRCKTASGLHCEFNLQILTAKENLKKSNKML